MAFTVEQLSPFNKHIASGYKTADLQNNIVVVNEYLTGKVNTLAALVAAYDNYYFRDLTILLKKFPHQWDHNDQLVLNVMTAPDIWPNVMQSFIVQMGQQIDASGTEQDWNDLLAFLQQHVSLIEIFHFLLHSFRHPGDEEKESPKKTIQLRWLKDYLGAADKNTVKALIKQYNGAKQYTSGGFNPNFLKLLVECRAEEVDGYLQLNLEDGQLFNLDVIYPALDYNGEKYLAYIIERIKAHHENIKERSSVENRFYVLIMLQYKFPGSVNDLLINVSNDYLSIYPSINESGWERAINDGKGRYMMSTMAGKILMEADPVSTKEKLWNIIQQTNYLHETVLNLLVNTFKEESLPFLLKGLKASTDGITYHEHVLNLIKRFDNDKYNEALWQLVLHKSKQVRQLAAQQLSTAENAIEKSAVLLNHKSADARQTAAQILSMVGTPEAKAVLQKAIANEKKDDARDVMLQAVGEELYANMNDDMLTQVVTDARERGKLEKPLEEWLAEDGLPALYYSNGRQLGNDDVRFLLYRMSRVKTMRSDLEARLVINRLDKEKSVAFVLHLIKLFIDKGTRPEHKYLLALSALLGNEAVADKIRITIDKWIDDNRVKMAEYGVGALALQGSNKALRWVELYSRKYRAKKANVGAAALAALEAAAEELNITTHELGDRIVPDLGFEGLFKHFTVGGDEYRAFIDSNFKLAYFNEDNKKLKSIPAAADKELIAEFKAIAKEVRDVVKAQSGRLEHYLVVQRKWAFEEWQQFFLNNPIMFIYATKILWGVYDKSNQLVSCFLCQEDTTLVDKDGNEINAPEGNSIGIVHPISLSTSVLQSWKQQFFDLSIEPVFPQLERPVYTVADEDKEKRIVPGFVDVATDSGSVRSTLEKYGWRKGETGDAGSISSFHYLDHANKIEAVLEVEGVFVTYFENEAKLEQLYFVDTTLKRAYKAGISNTEKDEQLIQLGNLSPVFYSEVIAAVKAIKVRGA